jgi:hypothetical protein
MNLGVFDFDWTLTDPQEKSVLAENSCSVAKNLGLDPGTSFTSRFYEIDGPLQPGVLSSSAYCLDSSPFSWGIMIQLCSAYTNYYNRFVSGLDRLLELKDYEGHDKFVKLCEETKPPLPIPLPPTAKYAKREDDTNTPPPPAYPLSDPEDSDSKSDQEDRDSKSDHGEIDSDFSNNYDLDGDSSS